MSDPFNSLISTGAANVLLQGANMAGQYQQGNQALAQQRMAMDQQNMQFMLQLDAGRRQEGLQRQQMGMQQAGADRAFMAQREESAFSRLNNVLDRQLKMAEIESQERQKAFENALRAQAFDIDMKSKTLQIKQFEKAARFQEFLGEFTVLSSALSGGDSKSKAAAAVSINALTEKNKDVLGLDPKFAAHVGQINASLSEYSTGYFKVLDDADPAIKSKDLITLAGTVDPADGMDADETQIMSVVLDGFRFSEPADNSSGRAAELKAHLARLFPGEAGSAAADDLVGKLLGDANSGSKFFAMVDSGAFTRPLSTDDISDIKDFRNELSVERGKMMAALRDSGMSPKERGQFLAAFQRKEAQALEQFALRKKGARDPEGLDHLKGSNVLTPDAVFEKIKQAPRPASPVERAAGWLRGPMIRGGLGVIGLQSLAEPAASAAANLPGMYSDADLRYELDRFYQDHVAPIRLGNGASLGDQESMDAWNTSVERVVSKFGDAYSSAVIREALHYSHHVPSWVAEDRALDATARRFVPGYVSGTAESPTEAIQRQLAAMYQVRTGALLDGANSRAIQQMGGAADPFGAGFEGN